MYTCHWVRAMGEAQCLASLIFQVRFAKIIRMTDKGR